MAKVNNFLVRFGVFSGILETKNGKSEIYFGFGAFVVLLSSSFVVVVVVSTGWRVVGSCGSSCFRAVFPAFCPLVCFALLFCLSNMPLFRVLRGFLARFGVRMYVCMGLGFCVDCGAFVRVWS